MNLFQHLAGFNDSSDAVRSLYLDDDDDDVTDSASCGIQLYLFWIEFL